MVRSWSKVIEELERRIGVADKTPVAEKPRRTAAALKEIGYFESPFYKKWGASRVIVVAGTNGKGSTCAALEALLLDAGQTPAFYSSPHLVDYTERFRIGGRDVSRDALVDAFFDVRERLKSFDEESQLNHFEILTLVALRHFAFSPIDWMILEVGLGGTYDATNQVPHETSIITALGMDHEALLGPTLSDIARNKLGIVPKKGKVYHAPFPPEISETVASAKKNSQATFVESLPCTLRVERSHPPRYFVKTPWGEGENGLMGQRGCENAALACTAFNGLGFKGEDHLKALGKIKWPGRMEFLGTTANQTPVYVSGDHNPQGIESLIALLGDYERKKLFILFGAGREKNLDGLLAPLFALKNTRMFLTETSFKPRLLDQYGSWVAKAAGAHKDAGAAFDEMSRQAKSDDMILVTGSLHLVGAIKEKRTVHMNRPSDAQKT